jgi:hypothetical protein
MRVKRGAEKASFFFAFLQGGRGLDFDSTGDIIKP